MYSQTYLLNSGIIKLLSNYYHNETWNLRKPKSVVSGSWSLIFGSIINSLIPFGKLFFIAANTFSVLWLHRDLPYHFVLWNLAAFMNSDFSLQPIRLMQKVKMIIWFKSSLGLFSFFQGPQVLYRCSPMSNKHCFWLFCPWL